MDGNDCSDKANLERPRFAPALTLSGRVSARGVTAALCPFPDVIIQGDHAQIWHRYCPVVMQRSLNESYTKLKITTLKID